MYKSWSVWISCIIIVQYSSWIKSNSNWRISFKWFHGNGNSSTFVVVWPVRYLYWYTVCPYSSIICLASSCTATISTGRAKSNLWIKCLSIKTRSSPTFIYNVVAHIPNGSTIDIPCIKSEVIHSVIYFTQFRETRSFSTYITDCLTKRAINIPYSCFKWGIRLRINRRIRIWALRRVRSNRFESARFITIVGGFYKITFIKHTPWCVIVPIPEYNGSIFIVLTNVFLVTWWGCDRSKEELNSTTVSIKVHYHRFICMTRYNNIRRIVNIIRVICIQHSQVHIRESLWIQVYTFAICFQHKFFRCNIVFE